jgi:hypothetical protein
MNCEEKVNETTATLKDALQKMQDYWQSIYTSVSDLKARFGDLFGKYGEVETGIATVYIKLPQKIISKTLSFYCLI